MWLLETTRTVQQSVTAAETQSELCETLPAAFTEHTANQFAWIGQPLPSGSVQIRSASAPLPDRIEQSAESATKRAVETGELQIWVDSDSNREYNQLRATDAVPSAASTVSIPFGDTVRAVVHLYTDEDLTQPAVKQSFASLGDVITASMERLSYRSEFEREKQRLEEIRSIVSHDFGNPLNLAAGRLDLVRTECDSEHIAHVEKGLNEIDSLTDEANTFIKAGREVTDSQQLSLESLATDCWKYAGEDRGTVSIEDTTIRAEPERLRRVLNELIQNSFVHNEGPLELQIGPLEEERGFHVTDDGSGIPANEKEYVFDKGYTGISDRDGNGLAVVDEIARAHGWELRIGESEGARIEVKTDSW